MSTLSSTSTLAQIEAAYDDNASYAEDNSAAKCRSFITACRMLLRRMPRQTGNREANVVLTPELIQKEMLEARAWLEANGDVGSSESGGPRVTRTSFTNFRD